MKLVQNFSTRSHVLMRHFKHLAPSDSQVPYFSTHGTVYATLHKRYIQLGNMWWGHTCIPHEVMWSSWALRYSKECPIQWDFQRRSLLESTPPLAAAQCRVTMCPHKPGTPGCLIRLLTCVWNLGFQPEKASVLLHSKHERQTNDGMEFETRPPETKCLRLERCTVFTRAADYIFLL